MTFETILTAEQIDQYTADGLLDRTGSITDYLDEVAAATPDKVAAIDAARTDHLRPSSSGWSDRCALGLLELGVRPGDVVSYQLPNWTEFLVLHYAATRIGAVNNPLIPIYREREVGFMVGLASRRSSSSRRSSAASTTRRWSAAARRLAGLAARARRRRSHHGIQTSWEEFIDTPWEERRDPAELAALRPDANDATLLIFTSGTTGEPKGVHAHPQHADGGERTRCRTGSASARTT